MSALTKRQQAELRRQILEAQQQSGIMIPPNWTVEKARIDPVGDRFPMVQKEYAFALIRGEDLFVNARAWDQHTMDVRQMSDLWPFWLMVLAVENGSLGASAINQQRDSNPHLYERTLQKLAKAKLGKLGDRDRKALAKKLMPSQFWDTEEQLRLVAAIRKEEEEERKKKNGKKKRKKNDEEEEEEEDEEEDEPPVPAPTGKPAYDRLTFVGVVVSMEGDGTVDRPEELQEKELPFPFNNGQYQKCPYPRPSPNIPPVAGAGGKGDVGGDIEAMLAQMSHVMQEHVIFRIMTAYGGKKRLPKVQVTITEVPSNAPASGGGIRGETLGYLVRFLQLDPTWNPVQELYSLQHAANVRHEMANNPRYKDPYIRYAKYFDSNFPVGNCGWDTYVKFAMKASKGTIRGGTTGTAYEQAEQLASMRMCDSFSDDMHPSKLYTLERALERFREAGAAPTSLQSWVTRRDDNTIASFPSDWISWKLQPQQVFWYHPEYMGLSEQIFPGMQGHVNAKLDEYCRQHPRLSRMEVYSHIPDGELFIANNRLVHLAAEADRVEGPILDRRPPHYLDTLREIQPLVERAQALLDARPDRQNNVPLEALVQKLVNRCGNPELIARVEECERWSAEMASLRSRFLDSFSNVWRLEGDLTYLHIPPTLKRALEWFQKSLTLFPNRSVTREMRLWDPDLSFFGNSMVRQSMMLRKFATVIHPVIPTMAEGLFSTYRRRVGSQLLFNILAFGPPSLGKSFLLLTILQNWLTIPGTVQKIIFSSPKSDITDLHNEDQIRVCDELPDYYFKKSAQQKHAFEFQVKKTALTEGETEAKVFDYVVIPGMDRYRSARTVYTKQGYTEAGGTNESKPYGEQEALTSRFICMTVSPAKDERIEEWANVSTERQTKTSGRNYFRVNHFLSITVEKAAMVGAICRDPYMGLWKDVSARMSSYLYQSGVIDDQKHLARTLSILYNMARQLTVKRAIHLTWDFPGSPHYQQPFELDQLHTLQRYLVCTTDIILFVWTLLSMSIIEDDFYNILRAACRVMGVKWSTRWDPYQEWIYNPNAAGKHPFLRRPNPDFDWNENRQGRLDKGHRYLVDLNYLAIPGNMQSVAQQIAIKTNPRLDAKNVEAALQALCNMRFPIQSAGFEPVSEKTLDRHRMRTTFRKRIPNDADARSTTFTYLKERLGVRLVYAVLLRYGGYSAEERKMLANRQYLFGKMQEIWGKNHGTTPYEEALYVEYFAVQADLAVATYKRDNPNTSPLVGMSEFAKGMQQRANFREHMPQDQLFRVCQARFADSLDPSYAEPERWEDFLRWVVPLTFTEALIIHYGVESGEIWKQGDPSELSTNLPVTGDELIPPPTVADIPQLSDDDQIPIVVELKRRSGKLTDCVGFSPLAIRRFDRERILEAFRWATMHSKSREGKYLTGWTIPDHLDHFQVDHWTREVIDQCVAEHDRIRPANEVSRSEGIPFVRKGYVHDNMAQILYSVPLGPGEGVGPAAGDVRNQLRKSRAGRTKRVEVIEDLDTHAVMMQHMLCGLSVKEPLHTLAHALKRYELHPNGDQFNTDYPFDTLDKRSARAANAALAEEELQKRRKSQVQVAQLFGNKQLFAARKRN